jgi:hypothetical protein
MSCSQSATADRQLSGTQQNRPNRSAALAQTRKHRCHGATDSIGKLGREEAVDRLGRMAEDPTEMAAWLYASVKQIQVKLSGKNLALLVSVAGRRRAGSVPRSHFAGDRKSEAEVMRITIL